MSVFDTAIVSNDLGLDRVLGTGLPVTIVFHEKEHTADLRPAADELARQYAGKVLIVLMARGDAPQAMARFGVRQLPALVTAQDGKTITRQDSMRPADLKPHVAHLLGAGPAPAPRTIPDDGNGKGRETGSGPVSVNEANFEREVLRAERPVLIDFWAPWCGPCHMVAPTLEKLAREQRELKIVKVNVDENPGLAARYGAMSIPTMIVVSGGREVDRWVGAMPEKGLRSRVARWVQPAHQTA